MSELPLPKLPTDELAANARLVAAALSEDGGEPLGLGVPKNG